jgi:hypothetical protein
MGNAAIRASRVLSFRHRNLLFTASAWPSGHLVSFATSDETCQAYG